MTPEIRQIREDEVAAFLDAITTAFLDRPDVARVAAEVLPLWDLRRCWAAFDGERLCGTFRSWATELTVPGGTQLPASAIAAVTVLPTHRRRGILRRMAAAEHAAIRERGEVFGLLYAAEYPIYGRLGYGPGCQAATWTLDAHATGFHRTATGTVELLRLDAESRALVKSIFDARRIVSPGEIWRRDFTWDHDLGLIDTAWGPRWKGFLAVHRDPSGALDGYVRYRAEEKWVRGQPRSVLKVDDLHTLTDDAHLGLWRFLAEMDLVATIEAERLSPSERLPWLLTNARAADASGLGDGLWVRIFDLVRALEGRTYERSARLVLEVMDADAPDGRTRVELDVGPDGSTCRPTDRSPDLTIDVAALGAAYLGGTRLRNAVLATGADEHRAGSLDEADALLRTTDEPWCSTPF